MQRIWSITQCTAIDASLSGTIIRAFEYGKKKEYIQMSLYAFLSVLLLFTAAIVSNIESVQQTLNLTLEKAYIHVFVPVEALIWIRSLSVVLLIVAHALKYAGSEDIKNTQLAPLQKEDQKNEQEESGQATDRQPVTIREEDEPPKALPQPQNVRISHACTQNYEQVKAYIALHQQATVREVAKALSIGTTTANKWMRKSKGK
ncbi:MAG TPA: hypothetical protein VFN35_24030 [Ktedonobacteraceae bacterium]|nr:hypothetical protein [Ktedonobacteraceae bacterium]